MLPDRGEEETIKTPEAKAVQEHLVLTKEQLRAME